MNTPEKTRISSELSVAELNIRTMKALSTAREIDLRQSVFHGHSLNSPQGQARLRQLGLNTWLPSDASRSDGAS